MNIIYISSVCAQTRFDRLVSEGVITSQFQNQKFHHLLLSGLRAVFDGDINVISFYPADRGNNKTRTFESESEDGVSYNYPEFNDRPIINHISKYQGTLRAIKKAYTPDSILVCNIMNLDECRAALHFRLAHKIKVCAIVADVPGLTSGAGKNDDALWKRLLTRAVAPYYRSANNQYDGYLFLSKAMDTVVNKQRRPYIIVEGIADKGMESVENVLEGKYKKKTILYAGGLHREYGIPMLVEGFRKLNSDNVELHIYGRGNYVPELESIAKEDARVRYFGTKSNSEIVAEQLKAHILVNPRPTHEEFVKYSFPSKIMECMASGTPLLTTRIPSMPEDYYQYIYTIDEESVDGVYRSLCSLLNKSDEELHDKGSRAKAFILKEKNPKAQGEKLLNLIMQVIKN